MYRLHSVEALRVLQYRIGKENCCLVLYATVLKNNALIIMSKYNDFGPLNLLESIKITNRQNWHNNYLKNIDMFLSWNTYT